MRANSANREQDEYWHSVADLMSGLMIVFLFIAVAYMVYVSDQQSRIRRVAIAWDEGRAKLYGELATEFKNDLSTWNAELDSVSLSVRFNEPDVLFEAGSAVVRPKFQSILADFFPRYVEIVRRFEGHIEEVRIEGHTSSEGPGENPYFFNMELSQNRTRSVLAYCLERTRLSSGDRDWLRSRLTANGLSSSKLVIADGREDRARSRRVEFRIRTNAETRIAEILEVTR